jgi:DNA repair exonuclease SbcCD ATPase subunit
MRTLRATDGTEPHLKALRHHARRCRQKQTDPFFTGLQGEAEQRYLPLLQKSREVEDAAEILLDLTSDIDGAEEALENEVRNTSDDLSKLDRQKPELGVYARVFPSGIGGIINPERKKQLQPALDLIERLNTFKGEPVVENTIQRLQELIQPLKRALQAKDDAEERYQKLFTQEQALRSEIREHLVDALARLTQKYKSNPSHAETFFISDPRAGSSALSQAENRGRVFGKIEALLSFFESKKLSLTEEQKKLVTSTKEEEKIDAWLQRAYTGALPADILVIPIVSPD